MCKSQIRKAIKDQALRAGKVWGARGAVVIKKLCPVMQKTPVAWREAPEGLASRRRNCQPLTYRFHREIFMNFSSGRSSCWGNPFPMLLLHLSWHKTFTQFFRPVAIGSRWLDHSQTTSYAPPIFIPLPCERNSPYRVTTVWGPKLQSAVRILAPERVTLTFNELLKTIPIIQITLFIYCPIRVYIYFMFTFIVAECRFLKNETTPERHSINSTGKISLWPRSQLLHCKNI